MEKIQVVIPSLTLLQMSKKPTAPVLDEDQDAIDDETFAELVADEECLHADLQNPQSIRSGQATSIV